MIVSRAAKLGTQKEDIHTYIHVVFEILIVCK